MDGPEKPVEERSRRPWECNWESCNKVRIVSMNRYSQVAYQKHRASTVSRTCRDTIAYTQMNDRIHVITNTAGRPLYNGAP